MKAKYLTTLAAISILSLGMVTSCANPCAGQTDVDSGEVNEANPCAGVDPGAGVDPCAGAEPCAGTNP